LFHLAWEFDCSRINDQHTKLKLIISTLFPSLDIIREFISTLGLMAQCFLGVASLQYPHEAKYSRLRQNKIIYLPNVVNRMTRFIQMFTHDLVFIQVSDTAGKLINPRGEEQPIPGVRVTKVTSGYETANCSHVAGSNWSSGKPLSKFYGVRMTPYVVPLGTTPWMVSAN
jgi:hypothetical protein